MQFSVEGLPSSTAAAFDPATVTASGDTTMTVATNSTNTPVGTYTLWVTGTSGSLRNFTTVQLTVTPGTYSLSGKVTEADGLTPIPGATVEVYRETLKSTATTDSQGNYQIPDLPVGSCSGTGSCNHAVMCSAPGHMIYVWSPVTILFGPSTTFDCALPLLPSTGPKVKEYVYAGSRLLAVTESVQDGVDFEQFTGWNETRVALPPLTVGIVTFSGGQICPVVYYLPAADPPLYGTYDLNVASPPACIGCSGTMTIDFAQPVSNVSFLLLNGGSAGSFRIQDDKGDQEVVTLPSNMQSGTATIALPSGGVRQVTIGTELGGAQWDFWIDNLRFTVDGAGGSGMMPASQAAVSTVHSTPAPATAVDSGDAAKRARAGP